MTLTNTTMTTERDDHTGCPVWIPMTPMAGLALGGQVIVQGEGVHVWDDLGRQFLDATSGLWNVALGYSHPRLVEAVATQAQRLAYTPTFRGRTCDVTIALARKIIEISGFATGSRVFFSSSGSTAIDTALKLVRRSQRLSGHPERDLVIGLSDGYHGTMYGSMTVSGQDLEQGEYLADTSRITHVDHRDPAALRSMLESNSGRVAAIFAEPLLGNNADRLSPEFCHVLMEARAQGVLLVVDEVATGFGRTGDMFASPSMGLTADVLVMSKAINSGYLPLAATVAGPQIVESFDGADVAFLHGETQSGNPISCAVALATIEILESEGFMDAVRGAGHALADGLRAIPDPRISAVVGSGLMLALRLTRSDGTKATSDDTWRVLRAVADEGVLLYPSDGGIGFFPPLICGLADIARIVDAVDAALAVVEF